MNYRVLLYCLLLGQSAIATERPLKILFMLYSFPTLSTTFAMGQIAGLIDRGHDISIFAPIHLALKNVHPDIGRYKLLKKTYFKTLPQDISSYDIIYCQFFSLARQFLRVFKNTRNGTTLPKVVVGCCGSDGIENAARDGCQQLFECVDLFLPVCEHFKNTLIQAGCDIQKIKVHHSAIDLDIFKKRPEAAFGKEIQLLSVGRVVESKGHEYAIHAFAQLEKKIPELRYLIIGDGDQRRSLEELIKGYRLGHKIKLVGLCSRDEIIQRMGEADILIHPSVTSSDNHQEGIPNVLMEAMAVGLPIISTTHGGIPELVNDGVTGFLVPEKNSKALADTLMAFIKDTSSLALSAGRLWVEKEHNIKKENDKLEQLFRDLCKAGVTR